jgi:DNA-binding CsgD family transcriptional regulator
MGSGVDSLSERERECLRLVAQHHTSKDIAALLGLSPYTVDGYVAEACAKLGTGRRGEAARILVAAEGSPPERLAPEPSPVPLTPDLPLQPSPELALEAAPAGRQVRISMGWRFAIIVGGAIGLVMGSAALAVAIQVLHGFIRDLPDPVFHTR